LEQPINKLTKLIASWKEENIELALQILAGDQALRLEAEQRFLPVLKLVERDQLSDLLSFPEDITHIKLTRRNQLTYEEDLVILFNNLPCQGIYCHYQGLSELPWWLFEIEQLHFLDLSGNGISHFPAEISQLQNLQTLRADNNSFRFLPESIGELSQLRKLQLDFNQLEAIPDTIGNLEKLNWLCLENNKIEELPETVLQLKSLTWLSIERTPLGEKHKIYGGKSLSNRSKLLKKLLGIEN
jgi:Leucine-rich repeat (LRR) protein